MMHAGKSASFTAAPARMAAFDILLEIERAPHAHADDLLRSPHVSMLASADRHLCTTLVMGVLRWQIRLDALIRPLLARPNARLDAEIRIALRLGAFQLLSLDRIPVHAAIGESVALAKSAGHRFASGMVNAVLRKIAAQPKLPSLLEGSLAPVLSASELAEATAHPLWMVERWAGVYGVEKAQAICLHGQRHAELAIRFSSPGAEAEGQEAEMQGIQLASGALLTAARRVVAGDVITTAAFRSGHLRIQEEGSQLVAELAGQGKAILDACAAPGGKTMILAERNPDARVTACEFNPARFEALRQRLSATPYAAQIKLLQADAAQLPGPAVPGAALLGPAAYDLVLADVPCSGTGTLGRNPEIRHRLQPSDLVRYHQLQCSILSGALRVGVGRVVYSTCSLEPEENAAVVADVLASFPDWRQVSLAGCVRQLAGEGRLTEQGAGQLQTCLGQDGSLTLLPGSLGPEAPTDGFFVALLEKIA